MLVCSAHPIHKDYLSKALAKEIDTGAVHAITMFSPVHREFHWECLKSNVFTLTSSMTSLRHLKWLINSVHRNGEERIK